MNDETEETVTLDRQINNLQIQMLIHDGFSEEYTAMVKNLAVLHKLKMEEISAGLKIREQNVEYELKLTKIENELEALAIKNSVNPTKVLEIAASLVGIFSILTFEKTNVLTTKALSFVKRV